MYHAYNAICSSALCVQSAVNCIRQSFFISFYGRFYGDGSQMVISKVCEQRRERSTLKLPKFTLFLIVHYKTINF